MEKYLRLGIYLSAAILTLVVIINIYIVPENTSTGAGFGLILSQILIILCTAGWIIFGVMQLIDNPAKMKTFGISLAGLLVVFLIGYLTASGEIGKSYAENGITTANASKMVGALLNLPIILGAAALILIVASEIKKAIS